MAFEIRNRGGKYYVVDTDNNDKIRGTYDNEDAAEDRQDELNFRAHVRDRLARIPVAQMTAEEKAAEYDRMMAEKQNDPKVPPKQDPPKDEGKTKKRSGYWGDIEDD